MNIFHTHIVMGVLYMYIFCNSDNSINGYIFLIIFLYFLYAPQKEVREFVFVYLHVRVRPSWSVIRKRPSFWFSFLILLISVLNSTFR